MESRPDPWDALRGFLQGSPRMLYLEVDADGRIAAANPRAADVLELRTDDRVDLRDRVAAHHVERVAGWIGGTVPADPVEMDWATPAGHVFGARCWVSRNGGRLRLVCETSANEEADLARALIPMVEELAALARDNARKSRELETAYWNLRKVREVLSICMECGRIRTDDARWSTLAQVLLDNGILASHGLCPPCAARVEATFDAAPPASEAEPGR